MRHRTGILKWWLIGLLLSGLFTGLWAIVVNAAEPAQALAVLTFENDQGDDATAALLTDLLAERLSAAGQTVVDRAELGRVLTENRLTLSGLAAGPQRDAATGKLVGARLLLSGRLMKLGEARLAAVRLLRVADARAAGFAIRVDDASPDAIADRLSAELSKRLPELTRSLDEPAAAGGAGAGPRGLSVAVLNFTDVAADAQGSPGRVWLGKALADMTIGDLVSRNLRAVSREQMQEMVDELHRRTAKPDDRPDQASDPEPPIDPREVAKVLKAARCVHGTFELTADGKARLTASLLDVTAGPESKPLHQVEVEGAEADLLTLQKRLAAELADVLTGAKAGTTDAKALPRWTENLSAAELLYRGVDLFDRGEYLPAWALFRRALKIDPDYADARYWTGRMMYYVQEYAQARIDLVRFVLDAPRHQRAGDAVLELVNSAQQTAANATEFVAALDLAAAMAPDAEVANQYGPGSPSTVAVYAASLAAQALQDRDHPERDEALMRRYSEAIARVPRESPLYWVVWHDMFALKVSHARSTGVLLPLPPTPLYLSVADPDGFERAKDRIHPDLEGISRTFMIYGGIHPAGDQAIRQEFVVLTPDNPTVTFEFEDQPLAPRRTNPKDDGPREIAGNLGRAYTHTRYFCSGPKQYLTGLDIEVRYRHNPKYPYVIGIEGDIFKYIPESFTSPTKPVLLSPGGIERVSIPVMYGTRLVGFRLAVNSIGKILEELAELPIEVLGYKVTGHFRDPGANESSLVIKAPIESEYGFRLDGATVGRLRGDHQIRGIPAGKHSLILFPNSTGMGKWSFLVHKLEWEAAKNESIDVQATYYDQKDAPFSIPMPDQWQRQTVSADYEPFRMGGQSGDTPLRYRRGITFLEDREGRWIVVWYQRRDLYLAISTDRGATWSRTCRLPLPVSSAHEERNPRLSQDSTGRYLLAFSSDRGLARGLATYICWSEDLQTFSAPAMISPYPAQPIDVLQRSDGTYLAYLQSAPRSTFRPGPVPTNVNWSVAQSANLIHWSAPQPIDGPVEKQSPRDFRGVQQEWFSQGDVAVALMNGKFIALVRDGDIRGYVTVRTSEDGIHFSPAKPLPNLFGRYFYGDLPPSTPQQNRHPHALQYITGRNVSFARNRSGATLAVVGGHDGIAAVLSSNDGDRWEPVVHNVNPTRYGINVDGLTSIADDKLLYFEFLVEQSTASQVRNSGVLRSPFAEPIGAPLLLNTLDYINYPPKPRFTGAPTEHVKVIPKIIRRYQSPAKPGELAPVGKESKQ